MKNRMDDSFVKRVSNVRPEIRQVNWQETEFYAFIHFSMNTCTGQQWGDGSASPLLFDPAAFDASQWIQTFKKAGMKGVILTCKHHDGFCLWPSRYTNYSVAASPWKNGTGDIVAEVAEACRKHGMKFGIYVSPWDRHEESYGDEDRYNRFFVHQLEELLSQYGDIFSVWFDGACGEGPNGKVQTYDWEKYYKVIRKYQPNACISVCGPDVRWCGNEAGQTRDSEWSVVSGSLRDAEKIQAVSQKKDDHLAFIHRQNSSDENLGKREILKNEEELIWYPCEVNVSIRPSWFYDETEDEDVKSVSELLDIYERSVGGNSTLLLNVPPDNRGLLHDQDVKVLEELGRALTTRYQTNLLERALIMDKLTGNNLNELSQRTSMTDSSTIYTVSIDMVLSEKMVVDTFVIQENILSGQLIESFILEHYDSDTTSTIFEGTTVGYKKIAAFTPIIGQRFRLTVTCSRGTPAIHHLGLYSTGRTE